MNEFDAVFISTVLSIAVVTTCSDGKCFTNSYGRFSLGDFCMRYVNLISLVAV